MHRPGGLLGLCATFQIFLHFVVEQCKAYLGKRNWYLFQRSLFTSGLCSHLADRCAGKFKRGEGRVSTHTGTVGLFGGIVESYVLEGPGGRWGCRLEGLHTRGDS